MSRESVRAMRFTTMWKSFGMLFYRRSSGVRVRRRIRTSTLSVEAMEVRLFLSASQSLPDVSHYGILLGIDVDSLKLDGTVAYDDQRGFSYNLTYGTGINAIVISSDPTEIGTVSLSKKFRIPLRTIGVAEAGVQLLLSFDPKDSALTTGFGGYASTKNKSFYVSATPYYTTSNSTAVAFGKSVLQTIDPTIAGAKAWFDEKLEVGDPGTLTGKHAPGLMVQVTADPSTFQKKLELVGDGSIWNYSTPQGTPSVRSVAKYYTGLEPGISSVTRFFSDYEATGTLQEYYSFGANGGSQLDLLQGLPTGDSKYTLNFSTPDASGPPSTVSR